MDGIRDEPKTVSEMYAEDQRSCPVCGAFRHKVESEMFVWYVRLR